MIEVQTLNLEKKKLINYIKKNKILLKIFLIIIIIIKYLFLSH